MSACLLANPIQVALFNLFDGINLTWRFEQLSCGLLWR